MSESKSGRSGTARGASSLEALSKTIDGLEARLENLVSRKAAAAAEREPRQPGGDADAPRDRMAAEILERQRMLDRERAELETRLAARRPAPSAGATDRMLRDIADSIVDLRTDLGNDISETLGRELAAMRAEVGNMSAGKAQPLPPAMREEMLRLADCIERLGERSTANEEDGLAEEVRILRATLEEVAAESRRALSSVENRLSEVDPQTLRSEVIGLVRRLDEMKEAVSALAGTSDGGEIEAQLKNVAFALETLAEQVNLDEASVDSRFTEMAGRLDEISRAIVSVGSRSDRTQDAETLARIEGRLTGLTDRIDELGEGSGSLDLLTERMTALAERMDAVASEDAVAGLADRLDQLSHMLAQGGGVAGDSDLAHRLAEISTKIDALDRKDLDDLLATRFDELAARIDGLAAGLGAAGEEMLDRIEMLAERAAAPTELPVLSDLEERLGAIVRRLDEARVEHPDGGTLRNLEIQLAQLSELVSHPEAYSEEANALAPRLAAIEEHLETNDEYIIEAARHAAEAVIEAYGRNGGVQGGVQAGEIAVISELAEDLRALESLSQKSEERTARAFDAVHDTLVKIAEHLEAIGPAYGEMPSEALPEVDDDGAETEAGRWSGEAPDISGAVAHARQAEAGREVGDEATAEDASDMAPARLAEDDGFQGVDIGEPERPAAKKGLLARVGERMRASRGGSHSEAETVAEEPARKNLALAPSIDPSDALDRPEADDDNDADTSMNEPLEPGSGAPDIDRILEKVREVQNRDAGGGDKSDFIAAARRAAQAAAAEVETVNGGKNRKRRGGLAALIKARRKPILLAVGAVLLVVMSWPLASALLKRPDVSVALNAPDGPAEKPRPEAASAGSQDVSEEKTGATPVDGPALPKVRALAPGSDGQAPQAGVSKSSGDASKTVAQASSAPVAPVADPGPGGPAAERPAPVSGAAAVPATGSAPQAQDSTQAQTPAPAEAVTPPKAEVASATTSAGNGTTAAADAVPQVPAAIGPQSLRLAASKGDPKALYEIGVLYTQGRGVPTDLGTAADWYRAAAERGLAPAQYRLANLYEKGEGVQRDTEKAQSWYLKAAGQGNVSAMHNLAVLYAMGKDGKPDYASAARWFRKAADRGVKDSQFNLAILYAQGHGVPRDLVQSYKWFAVAASSGDGDATRKRDQVAAALAAPDLKKARQAASEWKPEPVDSSANEVKVPPEWNGTDTRTASVDMSKAVRNIQAILDNNGFDAGKPDGIMGAKTRSAIRAFQKSVGDEPTGEITDALIRKLLELNQSHKDGKKS